MTTAPYQDGDIVTHDPSVILFRRVTLSEIALVLVRLDHVARFIVNANHGIM
jgi:hypothetical protein